jgi:lysine 6-dehydrogenase
MTLRIVIFGGGGNQGWAAASAAMKNASAGTEIVVVGRTTDRAKDAMAKLTGRSDVTLSGALCDVLDPASIAKVLRKGDVVLNAAAPFFRLGNRVATAAIAAGADYFDICDDWEASEAILELDAVARHAGVSVVTGLGIAPGISSMLAVMIAEKFERVDELYTIWSVDSGSAPLRATIIPAIHFMQCCVGPMRVVRDGRVSEETPLKRLMLDLPDGYRVNGATISSPEALTLARHFPGIGTSLNVMLAPARTLDVLSQLAEAVRAGDLGIESAARLISETSNADGDSESNETPRLLALATGMTGGHRFMVMAEPGGWLSGGYDVAGRALGLAPSLWAGRMPAGCRSIEAAIAPRDYFAALATELNGTPEALIHLTQTPI